MTDPDCPFCRKLLGLGDEVVWRFPNSVAFLGQWQHYLGYCVLASHRHARELFGLPDEERRGYLDELCWLARAVDVAFQPHKLNYELLGNQVPHLHWHVFPRYADDPARLSPVWLALDAAERDAAKRAELEAGPEPRAATAAKLREALAALGAPTT